jgi:hypothetical protein
MTKFFYFTVSLFILISISCEKSDDFTTEIISNDAIELRSELQQDGYIETIVDSIVKQDCYFEKWDKTVLTPVSGLIEFYDSNDNWVASIDFGDGSCDEWATKTWESQFSVFDFVKKEK